MSDPALPARGAARTLAEAGEGGAPPLAPGLAHAMRDVETRLAREDAPRPR